MRKFTVFLIACILASSIYLDEALAVPGGPPGAWYHPYPLKVRRIPWGKNMERLVYQPPGDGITKRDVSSADPATSVETPLSGPETSVGEQVVQSDPKPPCNCASCTGNRLQKRVVKIPVNTKPRFLFGGLFGGGYPYGDYYEEYQHDFYDNPYDSGYYGGGGYGGGYGGWGYGGGGGYPYGPMGGYGGGYW